MLPHIAIVASNTLTLMGLRSILQEVMPVACVETFNTFGELEAAAPDNFFHYFVSTDIVLGHRSFFLDRKAKTIVFTTSQNPSTQLAGFRSICVSVPESLLVKSILRLEQHAHAGGRNLPPMPPMPQQRVLSDREIEVLALIVQGYINKEIADRLNISITTVISHRKNITEKLGMKSVSALTIYAITHGYVDINSI